MMETSAKPRAVLFNLDEVPVARALREAIPLADAYRECAHYIFPSCFRARAEALHAICEPPLTANDAESAHGVDRAVFEVCGRQLLGGKGPFVVGFHAGATMEVADRALTAGGFEIVRCGEFLRGALLGTESAEKALARAEKVFDRYVPCSEARDAIAAFLRGEHEDPPAAALRFAPGAASVPAVQLCALALGPEVERWHPEVSRRLLELWIAVRGPCELLELAEGPAELGLNRSLLLSRALEARGVNGAIAFLSGCPTWTSRPFASAAALPRAHSLLEAAVELDRVAGEDRRKLARKVAWRLFAVGPNLARAPALREHGRAMLTGGGAKDPDAGEGVAEVLQALRSEFASVSAPESVLRPFHFPERPELFLPLASVLR